MIAILGRHARTHTLCLSVSLFTHTHTLSLSLSLSGRVQDLDALAGNVAFRHAVLGHAARGVRPPLLVTASVDELLLHGALPPDRDLVLSGRVIFVGASSMLVRCHVEWHAAPPAPAPGPLLTADILYVARDRVTGKASQVPRPNPPHPPKRLVYARPLGQGVPAQAP